MFLALLHSDTLSNCWYPWRINKFCESVCVGGLHFYTRLTLRCGTLKVITEPATWKFIWINKFVSENRFNNVYLVYFYKQPSLFACAPQRFMTLNKWASVCVYMFIDSLYIRDYIEWLHSLINVRQNVSLSAVIMLTSQCFSVSFLLIRICL